MKVIKRSGVKVEFDRRKIGKAILNAFKENGKGFNGVEKLVDKVVEKIESQDPHVEEIQDAVEEVLLENGFINEARAYIKYREQRASKRKEWLKSDLALSIWTNKYQYQGESYEEFFDRVARGNETIRKIIKDKKFLPAGRILANRGLNEDGIKVSYSNCYVTEPPNDNLESIIDAAKRLARTFSYGGGSGIDISKLRPVGSKVMNAARTSTGSVSFLDIYDVISKKIGQKSRRAALMVSIDIKHPDIENFIERKLDLDAVNKANMSVRVSDEFMEAAVKGEKFNLQFKVEGTGEVIEREVDAQAILNKLAYCNWYSGEPGCLFWDRIEEYNLLKAYNEFDFAGTNPCGEEPLPAGGSCLLGAINLAEFVEDEFTDEATFNYSEFERVVQEGVIFLNEILDEGLPLHPLKEQRESAEKWRQIGLGIMGLGSMLIKLGISYGSEKALDICDQIGMLMVNTALEQSALLAKEFGTFPAYDEAATFKSPFIREVADRRCIDAIEKYGLRNSQLLTIAPTGSISNIAGVTGGIEPIFKVSYKRRTQSLHNEEKEYKVFSPTIEKLMKAKGINNEKGLASYVVDAHQLNYEERIAMQATWQKYIDASISSTVNIDHETTVEEVKEIYIKAWEEGLKGITVFRDRCARAGILMGNEAMKNKKTEMTEQDFIDAGICPSCKANLSHTGGCKNCSNCGWGKCSI